MLVSIDMETVTKGLKPLFWTYMMKAMNRAIFDDLDHKHGSLKNNTFLVTRDAYNLEVSQSQSDPLAFHLKAENVGLGFTSE